MKLSSHEIKCPECGEYMSPRWYTEHETKVSRGCMYRTGRTCRAVSYLECENCGHKECVDDTFDGEFR